MEDWGEGSLENVELWHIRCDEVHVMIVLSMRLVLTECFHGDFMKGSTIFNTPEVFIEGEEWLGKIFRFKVVQ